MDTQDICGRVVSTYVNWFIDSLRALPIWSRSPDVKYCHRIVHDIIINYLWYIIYICLRNIFDYSLNFLRWLQYFPAIPIYNTYIVVVSSMTLITINVWDILFSGYSTTITILVFISEHNLISLTIISSQGWATFPSLRWTCPPFADGRVL